jgi:starch synthase
MRIAILTSEAMPFAKTGGLADVSGALPKALTEQDVDTKLILPLYDQIDRALLNGGSMENVRVEWRGQIHQVRFWYSDVAGAPAYLLEAPEFFARPNIYGYNDDHIRFAFFSRAALALLKSLGWQRLAVWFCNGRASRSSSSRTILSKNQESLFTSQRRLSGSVRRRRSLVARVWRPT